MKIRDARGVFRDVGLAAEEIWPICEDGIGFQLEKGVPPDPYLEDIAYRKEPLGKRGHRRDFYQPWWEVLSQRHFDCEDGSMWLAAHLRGSGKDKSARVGLIEFPGGGWHAVTLRRGSPPAGGPDNDHMYPASEVRRIYPGARIYGGPDIGWDPSGWFVEDLSRRFGMRDCGRKTGCYHPRVKRAQQDHGEPKVGRDPYVPFEVVAPPPAPDSVHDDFTGVNRAIAGVAGIPDDAIGPASRPGPLETRSIMDFFREDVHSAITPAGEALLDSYFTVPTGLDV